MNADKEFPGASLSPRGMVEEGNGVIILCDGSDAGSTIQKGYFLQVDDKDTVFGGNPSPIQFPESDWQFEHFITAGSGFGAMVRGKENVSIVKYTASLSVDWIYDMAQSSGGFTLASNAVSGTEAGSLIVAGSQSAGNNARMFTGVFFNQAEQQALNFGPEIGAAFGQKAIKKKDFGFAILGAVEIDRNDVITLISTDPQGGL